MSSVDGAPVYPRYSPVTVTSPLVCAGPGPVHVTLGPECVDTVPVSGEYSSNLREIFNVSVYRRKCIWKAFIDTFKQRLEKVYFCSNLWKLFVM